MQHRSWMSIGALALGLAATAPAAAQEVEVEQNYYYEPAPMPVQVEEPQHFARLRFGISGLGGGQWESGPDLGMGGAAIRLGVQLGDVFAVYYQPTGMIGSIIDRDPGEDEIAGLMWNSAVAELTLGNMFQLGVGPSVDFIWGCEEDIQDEVACANSDVFFGLDGRLALVLGDYGPGSREGFVIEARIHPTWYDDDEASIAVLGGLGFEVY